MQFIYVADEQNHSSVVDEQNEWSLDLASCLCLQNPFKHLYRDHDIEGMTDGFDKPTSYGHIDGIDDPSMGWARYAQVGLYPTAMAAPA
jgi:hypothetical protein